MAYLIITDLTPEAYNALSVEDRRALCKAFKKAIPYIKESNDKRINKYLLTNNKKL